MDKKICLWSSPRNISTALMYSFASRSDTKVFDEPLYAYYLKFSGLDHPGRDIILENYEQDAEKVIKQTILKQHAPITFHKLMTHFLQGLDKSFLKKVKNILLIRDPVAIISSYNKIIPNPNINDIGIQMQVDLYEELNACGHIDAIIDADELLMNPKSVLKQLCDKLDISFQDNMLKWKKGGRIEDGIWAKYWYSSLHQSSGFLPYRKRNIRLSGSNLDLAGRCESLYSYLYEKSIKA